MQERYGISTKLIKSSGGVFEVMADNQLIFSKKQQGRFPEDDEIFSRLDNFG